MVSIPETKDRFMQPTRPIDQRYKPPVKGIDLAQALNYIDARDVTPRFLYDRYTASRLTYVPGSRPGLEKVVRDLRCDGRAPVDKVQSIANFVAQEMLWAGYYEKKEGRPLAPDRNMREEDLLESGFGWCNEQARVFCALTQIAGVPSRLVFAANLRKRYGHVVCEVLLPEGWMMVDESFGYCFQMGRKPVRALDVFGAPKPRRYFEPIYKDMCQKLLAELGHEILDEWFGMSVAPDPLDGFKDLGFCNHWA